MGYQEDVARLEQIVEKMLQQLEAMKRRNAELAAAVQQRNAEIGRLQDDLAHRNQERGEVQDRLSKLITSIEEWEATEGDAEMAGSDDGGQLALNLGRE